MGGKKKSRQRGERKSKEESKYIYIYIYIYVHARITNQGHKKVDVFLKTEMERGETTLQ